MSFKIVPGKHVLKILLQTNIDLTSEEVTGVFIIYTKPSGASGVWAGIVEDGMITYTTEYGEIDEEGTWLFQARVIQDGNEIDAPEIDKKIIEFVESLD